MFSQPFSSLEKVILRTAPAKLMAVKNTKWNFSFDCEYSQKRSWLTDFEKSKIQQHNPEKLQFERSKIEAFWCDFDGKCRKWKQKCFNLAPLNGNFSRFGCWIFRFLSVCGSGRYVGIFWSYIVFQSWCKLKFSITKCLDSLYFL